MGFEDLKALLSGKPGAVEDIPFGPEALVFKVGGKMFAILGWTRRPMRITLKCAPDQVDLLRELYPAVGPGYYMDKRHWNTVTLDGSVPDGKLEEMIAMSYDLVVAKLPKAVRAEIGSAPAGRSVKGG